MLKYPVQLMTTPNQDILFTNIPPGAKSEFESYMRSFGLAHGDRLAVGEIGEAADAHFAARLGGRVFT